MSGLDQARPDEGHQSALQRGFLLDIQLRRIAPQGSKNFFRILGRAKLQLGINRVASFIRAQQDDFSSGIHEIHLYRFVDVFENSDPPNHRSRVNTLAESFVVEADIAAGNRRIKFLASFGNPVNRLRKLPHNVRLFWVAEVEAVGGTDRSRSGASYFAGGFGDRVHSAETRIEIAPAAVAVERHGQSASGALDADDATIARPGRVDRVGLHHMVILLPDPTLRANVGTSE